MKYTIPPPQLVAVGAVLGGLGVACGAFGAHGIEGFAAERYSDPDLLARRLENWRTGADYHLWHALAVVACGLFGMSAPHRGGRRLDSTAVRWAGLTLGAGVFVFSGSLYLLTLTGKTWLGAVTPIGGALFIIGWALLAFAAFRVKKG